MAAPDFISDEQMAALESGQNSTPSVQNSAPDFISDEQMAALESPAPSSDNVKNAGYATLGGLQNMLNGLTLGYGDEIVSGAAALPEAFGYGDRTFTEAYNQNLDTTRGSRAFFRSEADKISPALKYAHDIGSAALIPIPKGALPVQGAGALANTAKVAGLGALIGGVAGFGEGEGSASNRGVSSALGAAGGAVLSPAIYGLTSSIPLLGKKIQNIFSSSSREQAANNAIEQETQAIIKQLANPEDAAKALTTAQEVNAAKPIIQRESPTNLDAYKRTAEITQQPGLASLEQALRRTDPLLDAKIQSQNLARESARQSIYKNAIPENITKEEAASIMRGALKENYGEASSQVSKYAEKAFESADPIIKTYQAKKALSNALDKFTKSGARSIPAELQKTIDNFRSLPSKTDLQTLQDYRSVFGKYAKPPIGAPTSDEIAASLAKTARKTIDSSIESAVSSGNLPKSQVSAYQKMIQARKGQGAYEQGAVKQLLQTNPFDSGYKLPASKVPNLVINTPENAEAVVAAIGKHVKGRDAQRSMLMQHIWDKSTNEGGFSPSKYINQIEKLSKTTQTVLSKPQLKALSIVGQDLASEVSVAKLAGSASKNQSITSQQDAVIRKIQAEVSKGAVSKLFGHNIVTRALGHIINAIDDPTTKKVLINQALAKVVQDPVYAQQLLTKDFNAARPAIDKLGQALNEMIGAKSGKIVGTLEYTGMTPNGEAQFKDISKIVDPSVVDKALETLVSGNREPSKNTKNHMNYEQIIEQLKPSVKKQESAGNPNAISPKGATGLFQIMPDTGKEIAAELGIQEYNLKDPATSEKFYKHYMGKLLKQFKGDPKLALAAYNSGPGRVSRLLKETGGTTFEDIKDLLPDETAKYVPQILSRLKTDITAA